MTHHIPRMKDDLICSTYCTCCIMVVQWLTSTASRDALRRNHIIPVWIIQRVQVCQMSHPVINRIHRYLKAIFGTTVFAHDVIICSTDCTCCIMVVQWLTSTASRDALRRNHIIPVWIIQRVQVCQMSHPVINRIHRYLKAIFGATVFAHDVSHTATSILTLYGERTSGGHDQWKALTTILKKIVL